MTERPQQIRTPHVLGNFRPSVAERAKKPDHRRRDKRAGMSEAHLALIRRLPCTLGPERHDVQCHHLKTGPAQKERGLGLKATDRWAVPLYWVKHTELENLGSRNELQFFLHYGINPYDLANALWANSGDLTRMNRVLEAHKQAAIRLLSQQRRAL